MGRNRDQDLDECGLAGTVLTHQAANHAGFEL